MPGKRLSLLEDVGSEDLPDIHADLVNGFDQIARNIFGFSGEAGDVLFSIATLPGPNRDGQSAPESDLDKVK